MLRSGAKTVVGLNSVLHQIAHAVALRDIVPGLADGNSARELPTLASKVVTRTTYTIAQTIVGVYMIPGLSFCRRKLKVRAIVVIGLEVG